MPGLVASVAIAFVWDGYVAYQKLRGREVETVSTAIRRLRSTRAGAVVWGFTMRHLEMR